MAIFSKRNLFSILLPALASAWVGAQTFTIDGVTYSCNSDQKTCFVQEALPSVVSVDIPRSVTYNSTDYQVVSINFGAFSQCPAMEAITIPATITTIGNNAFNGCTSLATLTIADSSEPVTVGYSHDYSSGIDRGLFSECPLRSIYLGRNISNNTHHYATFSGNDELTSLTIGNQVTELPASIFSGCSALETLSLPESVKTIGTSTFSGCTSLKSITLPSAIATIGELAFYNCAMLASVTLPASLKEIEASVFAGCAALKEVIIPESVTSIGSGAFSDCASLTAIQIPQSVTTLGSNAFSNCTALKSIVIPAGISSIETATFSNCTAITSITLPAQAETIGSLAFSGCKSLTSIIIPATVTSIGNGAFAGCQSLSKLTVLSGTETLDCGLNTSTLTPLFAEAPLAEVYLGRNLSYPTDAKPFAGNSTLKKLTIGAGMTTLDATIFDSCTALNLLTFEDDKSEINTSAEGFANCPIATINLGRNISLTESASPFAGMISLKKLTLTEGATNICSNLFRECPGLTWMSFPENVKNIDGGAFADCSSLEGLSFEDGSEPMVISAEGVFAGSPIKSIYLGRNLNAEIAPFSGLNQLKHLTIGAGVSAIAPRVFRGCPNLTKLTIEQGNTPLKIDEPVEEDAENTIRTLEIARNITGFGFGNSLNLTSVTVYDGITTIGPNFFEGCTALTAISLASTVESIGAQAFAGCSALSSIELPATLNSIGEAAFSGCSSLKSIQLPSALTAISENTFAQCAALAAIEIPESVTAINKNAFSDCPSLTALTIADSSNPITIDITAFRNNALQPENDCPLENIYLGRQIEIDKESPFYGLDHLKSVTIGNLVETINGSLFQNSPNLSKLKLGTGVKTIGDFAFHGCGSLRSVRTEAQTPPAAIQTVFADDTYRFGTLYVAEEAMTQYQTTAPWDLFRQFSTEPETGIESVKIESDTENYNEIYNLQGIRLSSKPAGGLYIQNGKIRL